MVSDEGSLSDSRSAEKHSVIVTYWKSFEAHERSHADQAFKDKFAALAKLCVESKELGYDMLWQGGAGIGQLRPLLHQLLQLIHPLQRFLRTHLIRLQIAHTAGVDIEMLYTDSLDRILQRVS